MPKIKRVYITASISIGVGMGGPEVDTAPSGRVFLEIQFNRKA